MLDHGDQEEILEAISRVLDSGSYILGSEVSAFEVELARSFTDSTVAVAVANATDAIEIAIGSLNLSEGDEVIIPAFAPVPVITGVIQAGATPVLADVKREDATLDSLSVASVVTKRTRVVLAVHLFGNRVDVPSLKRVLPQSVFVLEDISQAFGGNTLDGVPLGLAGDAAVLSFYPTKNLAAIGDAGAILSENRDLSDLHRVYRQYGWDSKRVARSIGRNSRMDEVQAAVLRVRLGNFDSYSSRRREEARNLKTFADSQGLGRIVTLVDDYALPHLFVIETVNRLHTTRLLEGMGISTAIHYAEAIHQHPAFTHVLRAKNLDSSEFLASHVLTIPWHESDAVLGL